jgi:hypothetical protein
VKPILSHISYEESKTDFDLGKPKSKNMLSYINFHGLVDPESLWTTLEKTRIFPGPLCSPEKTKSRFLT